MLYINAIGSGNDPIGRFPDRVTSQLSHRPTGHFKLLILLLVLTNDF